MNFRSVLIIEGALAGSVDRSNHVAKVRHAEVHATALSEQAVVEFMLVLFGVVRGISDALAVLLLGVASPHSVDGLFASQEIISFIFEHLSMAHINSYTAKSFHGG